MILDFENIKKQGIPNFKDGEGVSIFYMFQDERNKIFKLVLHPKTSVGYHKHDNSQEIMYLLEGEVEVKDDDSTYNMKTGQIMYCKDQHSHSVINKSNKDAVLICSVTIL